MPFLKREASDALRASVQAVENLADECYKGLRLLNRPANEASWALLTAMAFQLETWQQRYGADSGKHKVRMVSLDRNPIGFKFIVEHGRPASRLVQKYTWSPVLEQAANHALSVTEQYTSFLGVFPMWHKNHEQVDLLADGCVRFYLPRDSPRQRQVIAFQQACRPPGYEFLTPYGGQKKPESELAMRLLAELYYQARPGGTAKKFRYEPSNALIDALRPKYQERLDENFRRPDSFDLGGYSLGEFKAFYIALLILCSIHEYICYPFDKPGQPIPVSSLVLIKSRQHWADALSRISGVASELCEMMVSDLTLDAASNPGASMCINPFVPLDSFSLAVAPQFPLASAVDDNIIRLFSYKYDAIFSAQNIDKEGAMRSRLREALPTFWVDHSIELPDKSGEIDVLLADEASSTVVLAELKWVRKPNRSLEQIARDEEITKGVQQLQTIRNYARTHPDFLGRKLPKSLRSYASVHFILIVWDHWYWVEPNDEFAILHFEALIPALKKTTNLRLTLENLLKYDWLPVEGRDFRVAYSRASANGAQIESLKFFPLR
ncbi:MAG: hypothetical protein ABSD70_10235 [Terracidiphilus sp.]